VSEVYKKEDIAEQAIDLLTNMEEHEADFEKKAAPVREAVDAFLEEFYGPRCKTYAEDCICCKMWKHRDELLNNPFNDDPASPDIPVEVFEE